jgi:hypothetical protein
MKTISHRYKRSAKHRHTVTLARESIKAHAARVNIQWISSIKKPDTDITVLIATADHDEPVWLGYWASADNEWRTIEGAAVVVTHWADLPSHPTAVLPSHLSPLTS